MTESVRRTKDRFDVWAENWAQGMRNAESKVGPRRAAQAPVARANRAAGALRPCGIKGCTRHSYKGRMCRKHYAMVPMASKVALMVACLQAEMTTAAAHHRKMLRELRASLRS